jgi:hypothetical protein
MDSEKTDDPTIGDQDSLLRRVPNWPNMVKFDQNLGVNRPSSACFSDRKTGNREVSVTHEQDLLANQGELKDALGTNEGFGLARVNAGFSRTGLSSPQALVRSPTKEDKHHCLIVGHKTSKDRRLLAKHAEMVIKPIMPEEDQSPTLPSE